MSLINLVTENIFLPANDLITGNSIYTKFRFLNESQFWTREQIDDFQNEKLRNLVHFAYSTVPFYKSCFQKLNLKPEDIQTKDDLIKLPILTKAVLKEEGIERITSNGVHRRNIITSSSSGSTGEPLFYYNTKDAYSMNLATNLRGWHWMGYRLGDRYIKLSQNERKNPIKRLQDAMSRNLYLASNPLTDSNFEYILTKIEKYKPKVIRCYPDPLLFIARYRSEHPQFSYKPDAIATTGNILFPEIRDEIETIFGCKIFDSYSCEGNANVFECPTHSCYHSSEEYGISEILDINDKPLKEGIGRLISTDLWNNVHPFIRYDTQDMVEIDQKPCACGRQHLKILRILGRDNEILELESGRKLIVHNFTGFFQNDSSRLNRSIDQFQVVKKKDGVLIFRLVVNNNYNSATGDFIRSYWKEDLQTNVIIEIVKHIPLTNSGKRRFILNE